MLAVCYVALDQNAHFFAFPCLSSPDAYATAICKKYQFTWLARSLHTIRAKYIVYSSTSRAWYHHIYQQFYRRERSQQWRVIRAFRMCRLITYTIVYHTHCHTHQRMHRHKFFRHAGITSKRAPTSCRRNSSARDSADCSLKEIFGFEYYNTYIMCIFSIRIRIIHYILHFAERTLAHKTLARII